jgi:segregation and condensation protein A
MFEGPLDVLLRLIEREQLPVSEVSLLAVLDQFMEFIDRLDAPPPDVIADFASVAGRLSVLKSRALLPKPAKVTDEDEEPDLVRQLEEYRAVKLAARLLAERHREGSNGFGRGEGIAWPAAEPAKLTPQPSSNLAKAVVRWLSRLPEKPVQMATRRTVTIREMISRIFTALDRDQKVTFGSVRAACESREDVAVAFLAMLTLVRRQAIVATQHELFGPIQMARLGAVFDRGSPVNSTFDLEVDEMSATHG